MGRASSICGPQPPRDHPRRETSAVIIQGVPGINGFILTDLSFGFPGSDTEAFFGIPLPVDLAPIGLSNCLFFTSAEGGVPFSSGFFGAFDSTAGVPADATLSGLNFRNQVLVRDPSVGPIGINASNGGEGVIGS